VIYLLIVIFGAILGSFFNVCIYRLPRAKSIVWPGSQCVKCGHKIRPLDNIPVLSSLVLGFKCRDCGERISPVYFVVELLTPLLGLLLYSNFQSPGVFGMYAFLISVLIVIVFIDIEYQLIPDILSLPGILIGLVLFSFLSEGGFAFSFNAFKDSLLGIIVGGGSIFTLGYLGTIVFRKEAMGGGDVKLMAMIGAFLGWKLVLLTFFMAPLFGSIYGIFVMIKKKEAVIPYAPYLSMAAVISLVYGEKILAYLFPII
jgi:leader peptidase (prepilin peptidase) / N-methyltransferase